MRQQALVIVVVIGIASITGTLCSAIASAATARSVTSRTSNSQQPVTAQTIISTAEQYIGANYASYGDSPATGFSCIGFVYYVYFVRNNVPVGQDLETAYAEAPHVARADLMPGDLVFFQGTVPGLTPLSHVGIYIGDNRMIAADSFQTGVEYDNLNDSYWVTHYVGATRPLAVVGSAPMPAPVATSSVAVPTPTDAVPTPTGQLTVTTDTSTQATAAEGTPLIVQALEVTVRSGPGDQYMQLGSLQTGARMVVEHAIGSWYQVAIGDQFGWVPAYAVIVDPSSEQPDVAAITPTPTATSTQAPDTATAQPSASDTSPPSSSSNTGTAAAGQEMAVSVAVLNVHNAPNRTADTVAQLTYGTVVIVKQTDGQWDQIVRSDGTTGWVFGPYLSSDLTGKTGAGSLKSSTEVAGFQATSSYRVVVVTATILVVRAGPTTSAQALTNVRSGAHLRVVRAQPGWLYVMLRGGQSGWVSAQWVRDLTG